MDMVGYYASQTRSCNGISGSWREEAPQQGGG